MTRCPATSRPIERAEPSTIFMADSMESQFRSFIFFSAISRTCALVTAPALSRPGAFDPDWILAACFRKNDIGGVFISKGKDRTAEIVITTGIGVFFSSFCVWALNALQNSMMLRPRRPNRGGAGGGGVARRGRPHIFL